MTLPLTTPIIGSTGWGVKVNQNWIDLEEMLTGLQSIPGILMSGDIDLLVHDLLRVNDMEIVGGWAQLAAVLDTRYYTQEQILDLIQGATFEYWLSDTADGAIGGYNLMYPAVTGDAQSTVGPITIDADPKLIQSFITEISEPNFTVLTEGVYTLNIHASTTVGANVKQAQLRWLIYERTHPGGAETLLATSEDSEPLVAANAHYDIHLVVPAEVQLPDTDRLVCKLYGVRSGTEPGNPDITIYMEGDTSSRMGVRTSLSAFDSRYLLLNGENTMLAALLMGGFNITNPGLVDGVDIAALKTDVDGFPNELKNLLDAEILQLQNIGAATLSVGQWSFLGSLVNLLSLSEAEAAQLLNINATTLSATQWGYLGGMAGPPGLTSRGDPAGFDWDKTAFTTDNTWRDLDCSAIVPVGARVIKFRLDLEDNLVEQIFELRKKGLANAFNSEVLWTQAGGVRQNYTLYVECDTDRFVQYRASNTVFTRINLLINGWYF